MSLIKYELYTVEDKALLQTIKENMEFFHMFGFTTFEQGKKFQLGTLSMDGNLKTSLKKKEDNQTLTFQLKNDVVDVFMTSTQNKIGKKTSFKIKKENKNIVIDCFKMAKTPVPEFSITMKDLQTSNQIFLQMDKNKIVLEEQNPNYEKKLNYTDFVSFQQIPCEIAQYYEAIQKEDNSYKRKISIHHRLDTKEFSLETNHNYNGQLVFFNRSILLNRKDAASYALELLETSEVQNFLHHMIRYFDQNLMGFSHYIKTFPICNQLFKEEIDSEIYRIYCGVQRKLHEIANPIRIEQLLEEMTFEKSKTKTFKNKA